MERIHILIQQERIIEECVDELIELIDNSRTPAFGGEDRRVVETGAVTEKFNILKEIAAASGNDKLLVEAKKAEDAIFCSPAPKFGSADFRIISFNDILLRLENLKRCSSLIGRTVLPFAANSCAEQLREIMNTDIIKNHLKG